jgi:urea transport system substrate-binding protein
MTKTMPKTISWLLAGALTMGATLAHAADTIKVGVLHSLSGTMAISETTLKDTVLMLVDEQNKKGGLLGKKLEAVVVDPASNWPLFAEKARELLQKDKVDVVFGCWTSVSRKSVLPVFEELNGILFYPVQYEGEESSKNVFYTGAAPNQQAIPAVDYLMKDLGVKRWVLAGTDYVYPRTTNKILEAYLKAKGVKDEDIMINYTPTGNPSSPTSRNSAPPARKPPWFPPSTATPTCRSTRNWATRACPLRTFRWSPSRSARKNCPASTPSRWSGTWPPGTTS